MSYINEVLSCTKEIADVAKVLNRLSQAFYITGNEAMGNRLEALSSTLQDAQDEIEEAVSRNIRDTLAENEQSAANTIKACLAVNRLSIGDQ